ncbi:MAG TPA: ABC transporter substrate-binding protein [Bryobacteraceae bacterium]|nr:ABC transporter substrate-binding protein [Bryobacteraceae bacterium]HOQ43684.1 ABC transporter substrate-binding protein [Bryobacteraceae bacterium]HPQ14092.1 ABC transporter substrate-binding protein [Bryobacteraceae bacterium]HPU72454.1 ABC transporter substrate-binding protein [Bryobacteraceae bacterium]
MRFLLALGLALALSAPVLCQKPYFDPNHRPRDFEGPGLDDPEPADVREVLIGYFGPDDPAHPLGGMLWRGAALAIEEANARGGYRGLAFRLAPVWDENPWSGGAGKLARLVYTERVWAIIGGIDGDTTHLAEQIVAKALLPLVNPAGTDRGIHGANVPWVFSCLPPDQQLAPPLARALGQHAPFAILSATDHDSRAFVTELKIALGRERASPVLHVEFEPGARQPGELADRLTASNARAAVVLAGPRDSERVIEAIRARGFTGDIFGGPKLAAAQLRNVPFPRAGEIRAEFRARFLKRYGVAPDLYAASSYDAAALLTAAIRRAGLNRSRIRDAIQALSPYEGASGRIEWDPLGRNLRPVELTFRP